MAGEPHRTRSIRTATGIEILSRRKSPNRRLSSEKKQHPSRSEEEAEEASIPLANPFANQSPVAKRLLFPEDESIEVGRGSTTVATRPAVLKARASERARNDRHGPIRRSIRPVPFTGRSPRSRVTIARGAGRARRVRVVGC